MKITFCGAAQYVTGSSHLVELDNGHKILLDCGLYQGNDDVMKENNREWLFDPRSIDCVILSHAHIDHTGRLPQLVKDGFAGCIHSTHATRSLCSIMLLDSAKIQERDAEYHNRRQLKKKKKKKKNKGFKLELIEPLYEVDDVYKTMDNFVSYGYGRWQSIHPDVDVLFLDAGHILGSSSVTLRIKENGKVHMLGFTGDIGRADRPILRDPAKMPQLDYLICESTYGDRRHEDKPQQVERYLEIIKKCCLEKKGKLIIPAFSVGRTQELVYMLDRLETEGRLPEIPVYVDSPLAVNATKVFSAHPECFGRDLNEYLLIDENPFGFNKLNYITKVEESKRLNTTDEPCIIISAAGMMNAGRVRHHLYNNIESERNTLLIVGYCAPQTTGGILRSGVEKIKLFGDWLEVKMEIETMDSFSAHGDQQEMLEFIEHQKEGLKELFLVHGEHETQKNFSKFLVQNGFNSVHIPHLGQGFEY